MLVAKTADEDEIDRAFEEAADRAETETGYRPTMGVDLPLECPLTPTRWAQILNETWARLGRD